tara:strand:+ start:71 stop:322 length:252 start_codon:yes stop_codon:yes gene_type:complete
MKSEKIKEELNDIKLELAYMRGMLENVSHQMQELREAAGIPPNENTSLPVRELYEHPWYKYKRDQLVTSGDCQQSKGKDLSDI